MEVKEELVSVDSESLDSYDEVENIIDVKEEEASDAEMDDKANCSGDERKVEDDTIFNIESGSENQDDASTETDVSKDEENESMLSSNEKDDDITEMPLQCHQFDWSTEAGLLEDLMSLSLYHTVVQKILKETLSDIIDDVIEYHPLSELKAQLITLHTQTRAASKLSEYALLGRLQRRIKGRLLEELSSA